jgi:ankyrin repeat protein
MLVLAGASLSARDVSGRTPVHIAAETCHVECLKALLAPIKEQPHRKLSTVLNQKDYNGKHLSIATLNLRLQ